jgi:hypothetical protein
MYGLLVEVKIEAGRVAEAAEYLNAQVVPRVQQTPGFVSGIWWNAASGDGMGLVTFDSEEAAKQAAEMASTGQMPMPEYVSMDHAEIVQVSARA